VSDPAAPGDRLLRLWKRLGSVPGGRGLFSRLLGRMVPYTGSLGARLVELEPGRAVATLSDRKRVRNHLGSIHAVALVNLGEMTTGLAVLSALPASIRGIVTGLSAVYLHKARGPLTASADVRALGLDQVAETTEVQAVAEIFNGDGQVVARVTASWKVGP
jgi:acyl-coenzyme A thioesterase PaaI-like protein